MKVSILFESNMNEDGVDSSVLYTQDDVNVIEDVLHAYGNAMVGAGFSYVTQLVAVSDTGSESVGEF